MLSFFLEMTLQVPPILPPFYTLGNGDNEGQPISFKVENQTLDALRKLSHYPLSQEYLESLETIGLNKPFTFAEIRDDFKKVISSRQNQIFDYQKLLASIYTFPELIKSEDLIKRPDDLLKIKNALLSDLLAWNTNDDIPSNENITNPYIGLFLIYALLKSKIKIAASQETIKKIYDELIEVSLTRINDLKTSELKKYSDLKTQTFLEQALLAIAKTESNQDFKNEITRLLRIVQNQDRLAEVFQRVRSYRESLFDSGSLDTEFVNQSTDMPTTLNLAEIHKKRQIEDQLTRVVGELAPTSHAGKVNNQAYSNKPLDFMAKRIKESGKKLIVIDKYESADFDGRKPNRYTDILFETLDSIASVNEIKHWGFGNYLGFLDSFNVIEIICDRNVDISENSIKELIKDFFESKQGKGSFEDFASEKIKDFKKPKEQLPAELVVFIDYLSTLKKLQIKHGATIEIFAPNYNNSYAQVEQWLNADNSKKLLIGAAPHEFEDLCERQDRFVIDHYAYNYSEDDFAEEDLLVGGEFFDANRFFGRAVLHNLINLDRFDRASKSLAVDKDHSDMVAIPMNRSLEALFKPIDQMKIYDEGSLTEDASKYDIKLMSFHAFGTNDDDDFNDNDEDPFVPIPSGDSEFLADENLVEVY